MGNIRVLDVTLRDGGCVNDFNFGQKYMDSILAAQEQAGIDIIELGYLDEIAGSYKGHTKYIDEAAIYKNFLKEKKTGITYVAMMDYGKFTPQSLEERCDRGIDGIRLAFHKKDCKKAIEAAKEIMKKGYELYVQPMITMRYSDKELLDLIELVNSELSGVTAFYIVDSFGEMRTNDVVRIWNLVEHNLNRNTQIGFHSHNNLQLSYSNAMEILRVADTRDIIIDSSIMGMGKGAGNLNTELLLEHMNIFKGTNYQIAPLMEVIDQVVNQLHAEWGWGYAPEYYLSAINHCTPTYASYFYNRHMLPISFVNELLGRIDEKKKISFDSAYAENLYRTFNEQNLIDDALAVEKISKHINERQVLLIAPGKSISTKMNEIKSYEENDEFAIIGLNTPMDIDFDYVLTTRSEIYSKMVKEGRRVIVTSNISRAERDNVFVLNYADWIIDDGKVRDSSLVIALKLLNRCNVKKVILAGFDGFSVNVNENYYDTYLRHPIKEKQADDYNEFYKRLIQDYRNLGMKIEFLTPSKYEGE